MLNNGLAPVRLCQLAAAVGKSGGGINARMFFDTWLIWFAGIMFPGNWVRTPAALVEVGSKIGITAPAAFT